MGLTETFEALADPLHRDILILLKQGRLSAGELSARFCTSPSDMSYHMKKLYEAGLVTRRREKSFVFYEFNGACLIEALKWIQPSAERLAELDRDKYTNFFWRKKIMDKIRTIAITGKGGTGKTVVATLLIRLLSERFPGKVLAIDADSAMSLCYTTGLPVEKTVSTLRSELLGAQHARDVLNQGPTKNLMRTILAHGKGFDLLTMGRPEEPGCFCACNELLRFGIDTLAEDYEYVVIDGEAGPEQLNRRVCKSVDCLLVMADMSARSLQTAAGILDVAKKGENNIDVKQAGLVLNRVRNDEPKDELLKKVGLEVFGELPEDAMVNKYDRDCTSLFELPLDSACPQAVSAILKKIYPEF